MWQPTVLVLAAGRSQRFAQSVEQAQRFDKGLDKLNAPLGGKPVRDWVLEAVRASGLPFHVVTPEQTAHQTNAGMGDSIAAGVRATASAVGWLILPADLPLIQPNTLLEVATCLQHHEVVVPFVGAQRGHPVGFSQTCSAALQGLSGDQGASGVVSQHAVHRLVLTDKGCVTDVDTLALLLDVEESIFEKK
jgi:molybdenum cofactor cytidylyltransferase